MIEKFTKEEIESVWEEPLAGNIQSIYGKINELCDIINTIQKEREDEWFEIREWIGILVAVRESVNIHEKQIDELQMKLEPHKCEPEENGDFAKNAQDETLKCPICGTPLEYDIGYDGDYFCAKCGRAKMFGSQELWQELIRTKKELNDIESKHEKLLKHIAIRSNREQELRNKLDIAVDTLTRIMVSPETMMEPEKIVPQLAGEALEQITALEQKDK